MVKDILDCSEMGDIRFSQKYAKIKIFGVVDYIENHYNMCKRFRNFVPKKPSQTVGMQPTHIEVCGVEFPFKAITTYLEIMWVMYLDENPELVEFARNIDEFRDNVPVGSYNTYAYIIRDYIKSGRQVIIDRNEEYLVQFLAANKARTKQSMEILKDKLVKAFPKLESSIEFLTDNTIHLDYKMGKYMEELMILLKSESKNLDVYEYHLQNIADCFFNYKLSYHNHEPFYFGLDTGEMQNILKYFVFYIGMNCRWGEILKIQLGEPTGEVWFFAENNGTITEVTLEIKK